MAAWENHSVGSDTVTVFFPVDFHTKKKVMHSPGFFFVVVVVF